MNCIVTAGPTYEPLDDVRRLTNFSTGRLGVGLANFLVARGHHVTLLIGETSTYAAERKAQQVQSFTTTADLREKLKARSGEKTDALFHVAAVSDFAFGKIFSPDAAGNPVELASVKKIPTRGGKLLVELAPTPKIIAELRGWFPQTRIAGWKYEADGRRADAIAAARQQVGDYSTDMCVANGPAYGDGFGLVTKNGEPRHLAIPSELFDALEKFCQ
jgi:phosphopantothenoylcysteine decarboxylase/phosphopantothenate--cysteine ligase